MRNILIYFVTNGFYINNINDSSVIERKVTKN